jgi:hypothetical protein
VGLQQGSPVGPESPFGRYALLSYPLKLPYAGGPGCIPLGEVDMRPRHRVEFGHAFVRPQLSEFTLPNYFAASFHDTRRVPAVPCYIR